MPNVAVFIFAGLLGGQGGASGVDGEGFFRSGSLQASYRHLYFPFNPRLAAGLFQALPGY